MGFINELFQKFKGKETRQMRVLDNKFSIISGYTPVFTTLSGGLYEMDLTRSAIHTLAEKRSKLNPIILGSAYKRLEKILQTKPNSIMTAQQFLYRISTILDCENNCYIIPIYEDETAMRIVGFYPVSTIGSELRRVDDKLYLRYKIGNLIKAIEYERVGHLRKHYYQSEYFGSSNSALTGTMDLLNTQNDGITNGIKQGANIRFLAQILSTLKPEDVEAERARLVKNNLDIDNNGGVFIYDGKITKMEAINSTPFIIDDKQMNLIKGNVFNYFGVNEKILQNSFNEDEWNAFYEGAVETFGLQLGQVVSGMLYSDREIAQGNGVIFESSRLQYASNKTKWEVVTQLLDRGLMNRNEGREVFNLASVKDGNKYYIRKEYAEISNLDKEVNNGEQTQTSTGEQTPKDTNADGTSNT